MAEAAGGDSFYGNGTGHDAVNRRASRSSHPLDRRAAAALVLCLVLAASRGAWAEGGAGYALTAWGVESGLPSGEVLAATQDLDGWLWLGTTTGLVRFDGARFVPWGSRGEPALPGRGIQSLVGARDGSVWLGFTNVGGVVQVRGGQVVTYSAEAGGPMGAVGALLIDRQGVVWAGARDGLFRFAGGRWTRVPGGNGYDGAAVYCLYEDSAGRLWVGTSAGVFRRTDAGLEIVDAALNNVQSLTQDADGDIWATDTYQIIRRVGGGASLQAAGGVRLPASGWRLLRDRRGQIWVAALGGGLLRVRDPHRAGAAIERFPYEHRVAGSPRSLFEDRDGNIWVGMRGGGLLRLSETPIVTDIPLAGLTNDGVRALTVTPDGGVWVATGHNVNRFTGTTRRVYDLPQTMALYTDQNGDVWAVTALGLWRFTDGRFRPVSVSPQVRWGRVLGMATDAAGRVWLCSSQQGLIVLDGTEPAPVENGAAIEGRPCTVLHADHRGRMWIGFLSGGVAVHDEGRVEVFNPGDGIASGRVGSIREDGGGAIWVSSSGGVSRFQNGGFVSITRAQGPFVDLTPALVEDAEGYLWVSVNSGAAVLRFHPREMDKVAASAAHNVEYALYDGSDGLQGELQWVSGAVGVRAGDGRLWFATGLGLAVIDPRNLPRVRRPPPPRLEFALVDGEPVTPGAAVTLPNGTAALRVEYSAVSLSAASKLRFRYMLVPVDEDWVQAGGARELTYTNLPSGALRLRVSATADGLWTEAAAWDFEVAPPFYRTTSAYVSAGLVLALAVAAAWWLRLRTLRRQYSLVFAERARVSREIHDTLLQSLGAISVELETIASQLDPSQGAARAALRRLRRQVGHALREARESIWELRHRALETRGLAESLRSLAHTTTETRGVRVELTVTGTPGRSSPEVDTQLFRIAQEAVNNAIRHGRAGHILITLEYQAGQVALRVCDDGCGFAAEEQSDAHEAGEHLGLLSMRERAARVRGRLAIISGPGRGTTIEAIGPLHAE